MAFRGHGKRALFLLMRGTAFCLPTIVLLLGLIAPGLAQVETRVRLIEASNLGSTIDPSLGDVHGQLGSLFSFSSYRLLKDQTLTLSPNQPVEIPAHRRVSQEITLLRQQKNLAEYRVRIKREGTDILNTQVRLSPGRTVLIGGPKHGQGIIIIAISANF